MKAITQKEQKKAPFTFSNHSVCKSHKKWYFTKLQAMQNDLNFRAKIH